ncbi:SusC/RagA family TonB-linked outer membrane protein [Fulvivirga maritima]|uniref:SusC/RagA family TonB-linked outer membrane protein n=1 Tax=Fulvivirga maritima TaxID=2904247 RepID=UPI001F19CB4F|nr:SusC/RagA family TonB-linked outer membrane protein [Fulvivirga maritima]UII24717.1 SusC/RagA family TonB-linked outer membrane protein [Fulvivirga maritima]
MNLLTKKAVSVREKLCLFTFGLSKWHIIMRIGLFQLFLFACGSQLLASSAANSQNMETIQVHVDFHDENLKGVFKNIENQTGFLFAFQPDLLQGQQQVNLSEKDISLKEFLDLLFEKTSLEYKQVDRNIVIFKKELQPQKPLEQEAEEEPQPDPDGVIVEGYVYDEHGEAQPGVSVVLDGTTRGTISNADGKFMLWIPKESKGILKFSFIGYKVVEYKVGEETKIRIDLEPDLARLDEVVVIGYGTTTKRNTTGSITKVSAEEIQSQPVTNALQALQGRTPGVFITQSSGYAGSGMNIQIRGTNSITDAGNPIPGKNQPLYIIDGVPFISYDLKQQSQTDRVIRGAQMNSSPLNLINPNDIESIDILKDADATAIYGSRGANGVVLITTKSGKEGKTTFNIKARTGVSQVANKVDLLGTDAYLDMLRTAHQNGGTEPNNFSTGIALTDWDPEAYTDWQEELLGGTAHSTDISASISGGNSSTNFFISGTYHDESTVLPGNFGYERFSTNFKVNHSTLNQKLKLGASVIFSADENKLPYYDMATYAFNTPPNRPIYDENGEYYWSPTYFSDINPLASLNRRVEDRGNNLITNFNVTLWEWEKIPRL